MLYASGMTIWGKLFGIQDPNAPASCAYNTRSPWGECGVTVEPGKGIRYGGLVYCSEAHVTLSQEEAVT